MIEAFLQNVSLPMWVLGAAGLLQVLAVLYLCLSLRLAAARREAQLKEMYGLMRKIEGLTAGRREQILGQFDRILEVLSLRLPTVVAAKAGELVYETERRVLARLAELEPNLQNNPEARRKMEELISSMEDLEERVVSLTSETVQQVLLESRRGLFEGEGQPPVVGSRPLTQ